MDTIKNIMGFDNWSEKITPMGWDIKEIDGHNVEEITNILTEKRTSTKPLFVIANTIKGKGVSIMENNPNWHFKLPNNKEKKVFMEELGISSNEMEL